MCGCLGSSAFIWPFRLLRNKQPIMVPVVVAEKIVSITSPIQKLTDPFKFSRESSLQLLCIIHNHTLLPTTWSTQTDSAWEGLEASGMAYVGRIWIDDQLGKQRTYRFEYFVFLNPCINHRVHSWAPKSGNDREILVHKCDPLCPFNTSAFSPCRSVHLCSVPCPASIYTCMYMSKFLTYILYTCMYVLFFRW